MKSEHPLLDPRQLAEIAALEPYRPGLRSQMLKVFESVSRDCLAQCRDNPKQPMSVKLAAHKLKGSATSLGAVRLHVQAAALEDQAGEADEGPIDSGGVEALALTLAETIAAYRQWLNQTDNGEMMPPGKTT